MSNSDHSREGAAFQRQILNCFQKRYQKSFILEKKIAIGVPAKDHKFDIVDEAGTIAIECKRYTWTVNGNVPIAKMGFTNEAAFYLSLLPETYEKYIVMLKSHHPKHKESLAEYYYRKNKHLLGKIKVAEYDPSSEKLRIVGQNAPICNVCYLKIIQDYLESKGLVYNTSLTVEIEKRKGGKCYSIRDHVRGLVYSLITNQTKWYRVEPHLSEIDKLFFYYEPEQILSVAPDYFCEGLIAMKCGNMSTKVQMEALPDNIRLLQHIEGEYGTIDAFVTSEPANEIVKKLSKVSSPYKMRMIGDALAWEYLRNVGIDGAKPDTHMRRFLGADRMGTGENSPATVNEVNEQVAALSEQTGKTKVEIDNLIWSFCADGYGEICTAKPHCESCPVSAWCHKC